MKIKFLSIAFALVVAVMFSACSKGPSGDPAADAKQCANEMIELMKKDIKSVDDVKNLEKEIKAINDKYENFYKEKGEDKLNEFKKAVDDLQNDPEMKKQVDEAQEQMMKNAEKFANELMGEGSSESVSE